MRKSEKRYFKTRFSNTGDDLKFIRLFDAIDKLEHFEDEKKLLKAEWVNPRQFSNLKAHLYKKLLQSLKDYSAATNEEIGIRESIDHIQLLFDRSLYQQSIQLLEKVKKSMANSENLEMHLEVLKWEKNLLPFTLGKNNKERVQQIVKESNLVNERISRTNLLTNLSVELNSIYLKSGYILNKEEYEYIQAIFEQRLPAWREGYLSLREKLLWYEVHLGYFNHIQDLEKTLYYARKWVDLFQATPSSSFQLEMYLKGLNHLLNTLSRLGLEEEFASIHKKLRSLASHRLMVMNENLRIRLFKYSYAHQFNKYFMIGDFSTGGALLERIESNLEQFIGMIDKHSELILFYKIACLHFGNEDHSAALKWINRIINSEDIDLREDVHAFARIINLIAHYELGNREVLEYAVRSTYRFLRKKDDLQSFQKHILEFIKELSWEVTHKELIRRFISLRTKLIPLVNSKFDNRAFAYFDIISWLDSKIQNKPVEEVIRTKRLALKKKETKAKEGNMEMD